MNPNQSDRVNWRTTNSKGNPCSRLATVWLEPRGVETVIFVYGLCKLKRVPLAALRKVKDQGGNL